MCKEKAPFRLVSHTRIPTGMSCGDPGHLKSSSIPWGYPMASSRFRLYYSLRPSSLPGSKQNTGTPDHMFRFQCSEHGWRRSVAQIHVYTKHCIALIYFTQKWLNAIWNSYWYLKSHIEWSVNNYRRVWTESKGNDYNHSQPAQNNDSVVDIRSNVTIISDFLSLRRLRWMRLPVRSQ